MSIFRQTVTVIRAGTRTGRGGDVIEDWSPAAVTRTPVDRLSVQPNTQGEDAEVGGVVRFTGYRILSEPGTTPDITGLDRIEYRGVVHVVNGDVAYWPDPQGRDHVELVMTAWEGGRDG